MWIKNFSAFHGSNSHKGKNYNYYNCLLPFYTAEKRDSHFAECKLNEPNRIVMPEDGENVLSFDWKKTLESPFWVVADMEALLMKLIDENKYEEHIV